MNWTQNTDNAMSIDYVELFVEDLDHNRKWLVEGYGFSVVGQSNDQDQNIHTLALEQGDTTLLLTTPRAHDAARAFTEKHGDGVADIGLRVPDAKLAFELAVSRGATPVTEPVQTGLITTATIAGFGDVTHTFVERPTDSNLNQVRTLTPIAPRPGPSKPRLRLVDHFAVCVEPGHIDETVDYYRNALGFDLTLVEHIITGDQAMMIKVVQSRSRAVTLTLIEADTSMASGQIDAFLHKHRGPGVQHMAFSTDDILSSVNQLTDNGVLMLATPQAYYTTLSERVLPKRHSVQQLQEQNILVDEDHDGQLYQIFARSVHPRGTLFLEIIERCGATTFGSANIKNLYNSVEATRNAT